MENRFGVKDLILFCLLGILILAVVLAMKQFDRQWVDVQKIEARINDQGKDLEDIKRTMARGVNVLGNGSGSPATAAIASTNPSDYPKDDPFARIEAARALPGYSQGDWLVDTSEGGIAKLTPFISSDLYAERVYQLVLETLVGLDADTLQWTPSLASSWKLDDHVAAYEKFMEEQGKLGRKEEEILSDPNVPTPVTLTFTLRKDAHFSDDVQITAEDFVWTFNWIMNEKVAAPRDRGAFENVRSVEKLGDNQVVFKFKKPYYDVMSLAGSLYCLPRHFYEKYTPEQYNQSVGLLMGSGPYKLESPTDWKPGGGQVTLIRNDRYWGVQPAFDRIIYKEMSVDVARQTAFRNGEIDVLESRPEQYRTMTQDKELMKRSQAFDVLSVNGGYRFTAWQERKNGKSTPFADKRVRRAMAMLIDCKKLMDELMLGYATLATGPFTPIVPQFDSSVKPLPYDPAAARALLAEAGFKDTDGTGVLRGPDGQPFRFKLTYPSGTASYEKAVLAMKDAYAAAGILLEPDAMEWAVFTDKLNKKDFDAIMMGWGGGNPEQDVYQMFDSSQSVADGDNFMWYSNPQVDALVRKARTTIDPQKRMPLWHEAQRLIYEDQPYLFMWYSKELFLLDNRIRNVHADPLGLPSSDRLEWFVPRALQKWTK